MKHGYLIIGSVGSDSSLWAPNKSEAKLPNFTPNRFPILFSSSSTWKESTDEDERAWAGRFVAPWSGIDLKFIMDILSMVESNSFPAMIPYSDEEPRVAAVFWQL